MAKEIECVWWVRIYLFTKTYENSEQLTSIIKLYNANLSTETDKSMWFHFDTKSDAINFIDKATELIPHLGVSMGNDFVRCSDG
jgi:hypothetical protein